LDEYIESGEFKIFRDIESIIKDAKKNKTPIAAVSSSENAEKILRKTDLYNLFDSLTLGAIKHKPLYRSIKKEDLYIFAFGKLCGMLDIEIPKYPIIFEDADKGVEAAKNIGYFCIGIAREGLSTPNSLIRNGADLAYDSTMLFQKGYGGIMRDLDKKLSF
jgi:beta-phosphoglucomutase-like phosphatase (HAD superfamily)